MGIKMIKELITDISYEKISLTQALTRAKLIAYKIDNVKFKEWIKKELNGYEDEDILPSYRCIDCDVVAKLDNPFHGTRLVPIDLTGLDRKGGFGFYNVRQTSSIDVIEKNLRENKNSDKNYGYMDFPIQIVSIIRELTGEQHLSSVKKKVRFGQFEKIIEMTKQNLLDILLELNDAFPNMENEFVNSDKNEEIASQIITTNIYGNNASSNVGVGQNFTQGISNSYTEKVEQVLNDLRQLGVPNEDINELENIINNEPDKNKLGAKFLVWSSALMTKAVEKGIDVKVPEVLDAIQNLIV